MKTSRYIISGMLMVMIALSSCNQVEESGLLSFGLELSDEGTLKSTDTGPRVVAAVITIQSEDGTMVYDKETLELLRFGDQFVTRSLELPMGKYLLTEFMLIDSMGMVLWATPLEGSPLGHLVNRPLPVEFGIRPNETTSLGIQVIRVYDHPPSDFGYVEFKIGFVDRFCLQVQFACRCFEIANDTTPDWDPSGAPIYQPRLTIWKGERLLVDEPLVPGLNRYILPILHDEYVLKAIGHHGEVFFEEVYQLEELKMFRCASGLPPLVIYYGEGPGIMITPEGLVEPNINQGVFGRLSMPGDTTASGDYVVEPKVGDIYFFPYHVLDSIYTFAPMGCYFPPDMIYEPPVAIVRTNSEGFFQVPLDVGEYLYMVMTEQGFYIDMYLSSRRGGYVMVYPEEVTKLMIHVIDCSMWM